MFARCHSSFVILAHYFSPTCDVEVQTPDHDVRGLESLSALNRCTVDLTVASDPRSADDTATTPGASRRDHIRLCRGRLAGPRRDLARRGACCSAPRCRRRRIRGRARAEAQDPEALPWKLSPDDARKARNASQNANANATPFEIVGVGVNGPRSGLRMILIVPYGITTKRPTLKPMFPIISAVFWEPPESS